MDMEARDLLTVEQAAQYLQVSQSSIRSYIRQGRLQAFLIAGKRKVLIPKPALLSLRTGPPESSIRRSAPKQFLEVDARTC